MARIELSLTVDYVHDWGVWEGIREVLQNGIDAEKEFSAPMEVEYDGLQRRLVVTNLGCTLERDALLMGFSSKRGRTDTIGLHGEGLKTGSIALLRHGCSVTIRTAGEIWKVEIETSDKFKARVLVFNVTRGGGEFNRVQVEVGNLSQEDWDSIKGRFLFLDRRYKISDKVVKTNYGDLLLDEKESGKIYVKGIYVESRTDALYGYNLTNVELDRDRGMVNHYDLRSAMAAIIARASASSTMVKRSLIDVMDSDAVDMEALKWSNVDDLFGRAFVDDIVAKFKAEHGEKAVPVDSTDEARNIAHYGLDGIVVTPRFKKLLETRLGILEETKKKLLDSDNGVIHVCDLDDNEVANFDWAMDKINGVTATLPPVSVVEFKNPDLNGCHKPGSIRIARKVLSSRIQTLRVLVHEVAHENGKDGDKSHVAEIERLWGVLYTLLDNESRS